MEAEPNIAVNKYDQCLSTLIFFLQLRISDLEETVKLLTATIESMVTEKV